jgi:hypothetical protein
MLDVFFTSSAAVVIIALPGELWGIFGSYWWCGHATPLYSTFHFADASGNLSCLGLAVKVFRSSFSLLETVSALFGSSAPFFVPVFFMSAIILVLHPTRFLGWIVVMLTKQFVIHPAVGILMTLLGVMRRENSAQAKRTRLPDVGQEMTVRKRALTLSMGSASRLHTQVLVHLAFPHQSHSSAASQRGLTTVRRVCSDMIFSEERTDGENDEGIGNGDGPEKKSTRGRGREEETKKNSLCISD